MIVTKVLNVILDFFDGLIPKLNVTQGATSAIWNVIGYCIRIVGSETFWGIIAVFVFFSTAKLLIGFVQWVWEKIPTN